MSAHVFVCVFVIKQRHWQKEEEKADTDSELITERMLTVVLLRTSQPLAQCKRALAHLK